MDDVRLPPQCAPGPIGGALAWKNADMMDHSRWIHELNDNEIAEIEAMTSYNQSITTLYRAMGTLLSQQGIAFNETPYDTTNQFIIWP